MLTAGSAGDVAALASSPVFYWECAIVIDLERDADKMIPLAEAAKLCPQKRGGKRPTLSCIYRWAKHGVAGIRLEVVPVGGSLLTTPSAIIEFFQTLKENRERGMSPIAVQSTRAIDSADRKTERELSDAGFDDKPGEKLNRRRTQKRSAA